MKKSGLSPTNKYQKYRADERSVIRQTIKRNSSKIPMPNYRRHYVPGGTYFFTANLFDRKSPLLVTCIDILRRAVRQTLLEKPFYIDAWTVLPDHLHCIWTLPEGDADYPARWKKIKNLFSRSIAQTEKRSSAQIGKGERNIWQRRYWAHTIRDEKDYAAHMDYVYINPVKHGIVKRVKDWPYSSFHRDVRHGVYPEDWAENVIELVAGERNDQGSRGG